MIDTAIVGGGMAGASLACALQRNGLRVALIDSAPIDLKQDSRLIALNYASVCFFQNLMIWDALKNHACPIQEVHVSQQGHFGATRLRATELNLPFLGQVVPAHNINHALNTYLQNSSCEIYRPAALTELYPYSDHVELQFTTSAGSKTISAKFVIGADGTRSTVRSLLNIPADLIDYQQNALVTRVQLQRPHDFIAYERFQKNGAIAMLPLLEQQVAAVWTSTREHIAELMAADDIDFLKNLQKNFGYRLGRFKDCSERQSYPLQYLRAKNNVKNRVLLIGNAAHTLHPIAAQGFNLALAEIAQLSKQLGTSTLDHEKIMISSNEIPIQLSHRLTQIFSSELPGISTARSLGLIGLDLCQPLKEKFIHHLIGQQGLA